MHPQLTTAFRSSMGVYAKMKCDTNMLMRRMCVWHSSQILVSSFSFAVSTTVTLRKQRWRNIVKILRLVDMWKEDAMKS
eukprot:8157016-Karenia_brevis.AAC.1